MAKSDKSFIFNDTLSANNASNKCNTCVMCTLAGAAKWDTPFQRINDNKWIFEKPFACTNTCKNTEETTDFDTWMNYDE